MDDTEQSTPVSPDVDELEVDEEKEDEAKKKQKGKAKAKVDTEEEEDEEEQEQDEEEEEASVEEAVSGKGGKGARASGATHRERNATAPEQPPTRKKEKKEKKTKGTAVLNTAALQGKQLKEARKTLEARVRAWDEKCMVEAALMSEELGLDIDEVKRALSHASKWKKKRAYNVFAAKVWKRMAELNEGGFFFIPTDIHLIVVQTERRETASPCQWSSRWSPMSQTMPGPMKSSPPSSWSTWHIRTRSRGGRGPRIRQLPKMWHCWGIKSMTR